MTDITNAKTMARALRESLAAKSIAVSHSEALELVAKAHGCADWNTFCAMAAGGHRLEDAIPILRMMDVPKTKAFYIDLLGFSVDFEHRFEEGFPLFMQVSRDGLRLHLSEHHGDATPGSAVYIYMKGLDLFHAEISARGSHAGIEEGPVPGMRVLRLWDPVSNRLIFAERDESLAKRSPGARAHPA